jgi:hypothetical protein
MTDDSMLMIVSNGICEVHDFGKGFFLEDYSSDYNQGTRGVVVGKWKLVNVKGEWEIHFEFNLPTGKFRRQARISQSGERLAMSFWIGWPDTSPLLILQKSTY